MYFFLIGKLHDGVEIEKNLNDIRDSTLALLVTLNEFIYWRGKISLILNKI